MEQPQVNMKLFKYCSCCAQFPFCGTEECQTRFRHMGVSVVKWCEHWPPTSKAWVWFSKQSLKLFRFVNTCVCFMNMIISSEYVGRYPINYWEVQVFSGITHFSLITIIKDRKIIMGLRLLDPAWDKLLLLSFEFNWLSSIDMTIYSIPYIIWWNHGQNSLEM